MSQNGESNGSTSLLTDAEAQAIKTTWDAVWADKKNNGIQFFIKFFTHHPAAIEKFRDFQGLSIEEIAVHKKLRAHALSVFYGIKSFVDNLDDIETLTELIKKNARNHAERGISGTEIKMLVPPFVELLEEKLPGQVTDLHKTAWSKVFDVISIMQDDALECHKEKK